VTFNPITLSLVVSCVTRFNDPVETQTASSATAIQSASPPTLKVASGLSAVIGRRSAVAEPGGGGLGGAEFTACACAIAKTLLKMNGKQKSIAAATL
jgi:hypothetical protein